jgi:hypothetical protein
MIRLLCNAKQGRAWSMIVNTHQGNLYQKPEQKRQFINSLIMLRIRIERIRSRRHVKSYKYLKSGCFSFSPTCVPQWYNDRRCVFLLLSSFGRQTLHLVFPLPMCKIPLSFKSPPSPHCAIWERGRQRPLTCETIKRCQRINNSPFH